jgi:type II secretory pathway component PulK
MALVAAIALLAVFALLGTAYVGYMWLEFEDAGVQLHRTRARSLAAGGIYAAIGDLQIAIGDSQPPAATFEYSFATYRAEQGGPGAYPQRVTVNVLDESARVDLNTASTSLLAALGFESDAIDKLRTMRADRHRLAGVDSLRVDEIVGAQEFETLDRADLTVYTGGTLNLNSVSPRVLSAAFGISNGEAEALAAQRPFANWADVLQKVGREPSAFNLDIPSFAPREKPAQVAFESRCFRLRSAATLDMPGGDHRPVHAAVEAVVLFNDDGTYAIRLWRELRGAEARESAEATPITPLQSPPMAEAPTSPGS